jgi:hypothetical protein
VLLSSTSYRQKPKHQDQVDGLEHEMDVAVPKGYVWDGAMQVRACLLLGAGCR